MISTSIKHRNDIDGLRAIAVLSVIGFHAFPSIVKGGFVGVDIFFVISGFLITSIIASSIQNNNFSFLEFYGRRIKRIFPALILVLACNYIFGWYVLLADEYKQLGKHVAAGASFISNFILWNESSYFDNTAETKPLLHLWSLGIEEQFYIIWPILIWVGWKLKASLLKLSIVILIASLFMNLATINIDSVAAFYSPLTRFWELSVGSALALFISINSIKNEQIATKVARFDILKLIERAGINAPSIFSFLGVFLVLISMLLITKNTLFPGWWACLPTVGTFFVICSGSQAWFNRTILSNRFLVWIGLISFPLYLWHWSLLSYAHIILGDIPSRLIRCLLIIISVLLAWLTFKFIEKPIRFGNSFKNTKIKVLITLMFAFLALGYLTYRTDGMPNRKIALLTTELTKSKSDWIYKSTKLESGEITGLNILKGRSPESVLFIGDSLMGQYYARAEKIYGDQSNLPFYTSVFASRNHCRPIPYTNTISAPEHINCDDYYVAAIKLAQMPIYKKIVFSGNWESAFRDNPFNENLKKLELDVNNLREHGKQIFFISMAPHSKFFDPVHLAQYYRFPILQTTVIANRWVSRRELESLDGSWYEKLSNISKLTNAKIINPYDYFCRADDCPILIENKPLYNDGYHLRASAASTYATFIDEIVIQ